MVTDPNRWDNRKVMDFSDLHGCFQDQAFGHLMRNAIGGIQRLRDDGRGYWSEDSKEGRRWRKACNRLWKFLERVDLRRSRGEPLEEILREFFGEFEHQSDRLRQLLHQKQASETADKEREQASRWLEFIFRAATYAIVAAWFNYKRVNQTVYLTLNMTTGKWTERSEREEFRVPRQHRKPPR